MAYHKVMKLCKPEIIGISIADFSFCLVSHSK